MLADDTLRESVALLVRLRLSRARMLARAQRNLARIAATLRSRPSTGLRRLKALQREPRVYPVLDAISEEEMATWMLRRWDWSSHLFAE